MSILWRSSRAFVATCTIFLATLWFAFDPARAVADGIGPAFQIGYGPEGSRQIHSEVAFDGTNYLVVWEDNRGDTWDIYAARVNPTGTVLDPQGIPIAVALSNQLGPAVAFDGTNYMVVWEDYRDGAPPEAYGARVTPSGTVLDPSGFLISTNPGLRGGGPKIAFDGTNYLVAWTDATAWGSGGIDVFCARVTTSGTVLDPSGMMVAGGPNRQSRIDVTFGGTNYMIVWGDQTAARVYGCRVSTAGDVLDPSGIPISTTGTSYGDPAIAFDGTNYMAVWEDARVGGWGGDIYGARITTSGTVLDASGILVATASEAQRLSEIAFDGTNYRVVWNTGCGYRCDDVYAARVAPSGTVLDPISIPVSTAPNEQGYPRIAAGSSGDLLVVYWSDELGSSRIWGNLWGGGLVNISGVKFNDANGNGTRQGSEEGLPGWTIQLNPGGRATLTDQNGEYFFSFLNPDVYTVNEVLKPNWEQTCPAGNTYVLDLTSGLPAADIDFGNRALVDVQDLTVSVGGGRARPGFEKRYGITYQNKGTRETIATVTLELPPEVTHLDSSPGGVYNAAKGEVKWSLGSLAPGTIGWLWTRVQVPATVPLGSVLTSTAHIKAPGSDDTPGDNDAKESQVVTGSFDPNDKQTTPEGFIMRSDTLRYQVNFQNVGTDTAFNIVVRDTLDLNLDLATVESGASLHPCVFQIIDRELSWRFPNIQLPDSNVNEPGSHGFVTFKVLPTPELAAGTEIKNRAGVYFDFNPPVVTNTVLNTVVDALPAAVDLHPNTLNLESEGRYVTCYIEAPGGYDAEDIDVNTVLFNGELSAVEAPTTVADHDSDGVADVMVKFTRSGVIGFLGGEEGSSVLLWERSGDSEPFAHGEKFEVAVSGQLSDGRAFVGVDTIRVIEPPPGGEDSGVVLEVVASPVREAARISYGLDEGGPVSLQVYDVMGRLVRVLVEGHKSAGLHELTWDCRTQDGKQVGSGVYFIRLEQEGTIRLEKVLVVR